MHCYNCLLGKSRFIYSGLLTDNTVVGDSVKSRICVVVETSDLTEQEAWQYLLHSRPVSVANAQDVYEQISGRINQLPLGADGHQRGRELARI